MKVTSKQGRLTQALLKGQSLTVAQIAARFGIKNPTATISDIRGSGVRVLTAKNKTGKTVYSV
jgi:hypothetical protein